MNVDETDDGTEFTEGRYLYCVVAGESSDFETEGIGGDRVYSIQEDGIAAIVHACDSLYDTEDLDRLREWLLDHQSVVDHAGETFGTPLPFQFDTVIKGDDDMVQEWLRDTREQVEFYLSELQGYWEYRVDIVRHEVPEFDDELLEQYRGEIEGADQGRAFLLQKRLDQRRNELRKAIDDEITNDARAQLEQVVRNLQVVPDTDKIASFALLVHEDNEEVVGNRLDVIAEREGIEVRFTGPWPPYSFAPDL